MNRILCSLLMLCAVSAGCEPDAMSPEASAPEASLVTIDQKEITDDGVHVATLSNGMVILAKAVRTAPVVSVRAYVRAGGMLEQEWLGCGLSHLSEHLVAKEAIHDSPQGQSTPAIAKEKRGRSLEIGGQANAYTSLDRTCYYISASSTKAPLCVDLIVDQVSRWDITPEDFQREHGVVQRELEMGKDDPSRVLYYAHSKAVFGDHPAAVPVIGYARPLSQVTRDDILAYVNRMYVPQNMVLTIVGDVDCEAMVDRAVQRLQHFTHGREPNVVLPAVADLRGIRRGVIVSPKFKETAQRLSFQTIPLLHEDLYALDVLSYILSRGRASRLVKTLQFDRRLVTSIRSWSWTPVWGKGTFTFDFRVEPAKADEAEAALLTELRRVVEEGVTDEELHRAKRQKVADYVHSQQTMEDIGSTLASDWMTTGDLRFSKRYTDNIQKVTAGQVREAARRYFRFEDMVITRVVPEGADTAALAPADQAVRSETEIFTLPNGLRVVLRTSDAVDLVSMAMAVQGGLLLETPETNGIGQMMAMLSTRGAGGRSAEDIEAFFNAAGGSISGTCGDNTFLWQASVLADEFPEALDCFADVILQPDFPAGELEKLRPQALAAIRRTREKWISLLGSFQREMFFRNSPWRMLSIGSEDVLKSLDTSQIKAYHDGRLKAGAAVLAICGRFDAAAARKAIEEHFGAMPGGEVTLPDVPQRTVAKGGERYVRQAPLQQAGVMVSVPGTTVTDLHDRMALTLIDTIISGYRLPSGWLHTELRGKQLVYVVHTYQKLGFIPGAIITYAGTQPEKAQQVVDIIEKNLRRAASYTPTQEQLDQAVNLIVTAEALGNQTLSALATGAALDELYGLGYDWPRRLGPELRKITPEDIRSVAEEYLGGNYVVTVVTPQPDLLDDAELIPVEETDEQTAQTPQP